MNAITTAHDESRMIGIMRESVFPGASPDSIRMVLGYCQARGLDPLRKPVHIVPMWVKPSGTKQGAMQDVIMPGIALYRIEAARTGGYAGKSEPVFGPTITADLGGAQVRYPEWCSVTVFRMVAGEARAFPAREYWLENYATAGRDTDRPNTMWAKRAFGQIAKCAEAQALRMAFPEATGGEPTAEEMEGKAPPREVASTVVEEAPAGSMRSFAQTITQPATDPAIECARDLVARIRGAETMADLAGITAEAAVIEKRATLKDERPKLAERINAAVSEMLEKFDAAPMREPGGEG